MNDVRNRVGDFFTAPDTLALLDCKRRACRFTRRDHSAAVNVNWPAQAAVKQREQDFLQQASMR
jgi:hypothetical protein